MIDVTAMLLCFINHTLGNGYGPGGSFQRAKVHVPTKWIANACATSPCYVFVFCFFGLPQHHQPSQFMFENAYCFHNRPGSDSLGPEVPSPFWSRSIDSISKGSLIKIVDSILVLNVGLRFASRCVFVLV